MRGSIFASFPVLLWLCGCALGGIAVRKAAPSVHHQTFDPNKPPANMPKLAPPEAAVTVCSFGFSAEPSYDVVRRQREADGTFTAVISVNDVAVYVRLNIIIWTPKDASEKLKAHEEGHRKLDEMMYQKLAEDAARAAGAEMDGHQFTGHGKSEGRAVSDAVTSMFQQAGHDYLAQSSAINDQVNQAYDAITEHGSNDISVEQAIRQALEREGKGSPQ